MVEGVAAAQISWVMASMMGTSEKLCQRIEKVEYVYNTYS